MPPTLHETLLGEQYLRLREQYADLCSHPLGGRDSRLADFDTISGMPTVQKVAIDMEQHTLLIQTTPITIPLPEGMGIPLGPMVVVIQRATFAHNIRIYGMDTDLVASHKDYPHPNVKKDGSICILNGGEKELKQHIGRGTLVPVVGFCLEILPTMSSTPYEGVPTWEGYAKPYNAGEQ